MKKFLFTILSLGIFINISPSLAFANTVTITQYQEENINGYPILHISWEGAFTCDQITYFKITTNNGAGNSVLFRNPPPSFPAAAGEGCKDENSLDIALDWQGAYGEVRSFTNNQILFEGQYNGEYYEVLGFQNDFDGTVFFTETNNPIPKFGLFSSASINEGDTYNQTLYFSDSDSNSWTANINYGDGTPADTIELNNKVIQLNHSYKQNGSYPVQVSVTDDQGNSDSTSTTIVVKNVAPNVNPISVSDINIQANSNISAITTFNDVGILDTHTATWNWGDGTTTTGTVTESNGSGSVSGTHTYASAGVYEITLTVTDNNSASDLEVYHYLSVYNPTNQGLFTGARKFNSPAGAYAPDPTLTGQVQFGITTKYQDTTPTGNVSMKFSAADFEFNSTAVTLLVTADGVATVRGTGTINGSGNFNFLVTGLDGTIDKVRFQIKDPNNGNAVIYDSQPGANDTTSPTTPIIGQIIIH